MPEKANIERKTLKELSQELTATQILYLLGETLLLEIDEKAEVEYAEGEQPNHLIFKMENGRILSVLVMDILQPSR